MTKTCMFTWTDNDGKPGSNHVCAEPHGHAMPHACASCTATHDGALPIEVTVRDEAAIENALAALFRMPDNVKPTEAADRFAELLDAIGTAPALDMARRVREARCDGDRLMAVFDEIGRISNAAVRS